MNRTKILALLNILVLGGTIFWNYYANTGIINGNDVGSLSDQYNSLFTPAGYTFAIWGFIYLGLTYQSIYFVKCAFSQKRENDFIVKAGPWVILANLANSAWLWFWLNEEIGTSVILLLAITFFLLIAVLRLNMEKWDAPVNYMAGVWWPIDLYIGWVSVASIANLSIYLKTIGWSAGLSEVGWTVTMILVAFTLNVFMVISRNMREFAVVGIWALMGIAAQHWGEISAIQWTAVACSAGLFITINIHSYLNRHTLPIFKSRK